MTLRQLLLAAALVLCPFALALAQEEPPEPEEKPPEKKAGSLRLRPDEDPAAAQFIAKLSPARPQMAGVAPQSLLRHTLSPDGQYLYYFRNLNAPAPKPATAREPASSTPDPRYVLFRAGAGGSEEKVLETGFDAIAPLFLPEGRLAVVTRTLDLNGDGVLDHNDERSLIMCGADGSSAREVTALRAQETPLAVWREGKEILLAAYSRDDVNGWIVTLPLSRGQRTPLTRGFNVSMVLEDGRLLIERFVAPPPPAEQPINPWAWRNDGEEDGADEVEPPPVASLLDRSVHVLFNPTDGSEVELYNPAQRARLSVFGEGSFFGCQQATRNIGSTRFPAIMGRVSRSVESFEFVVVDSSAQYDTRAPHVNNNYFPLAWINGRGLLLTEVSNLKTRLLLMDRSSKLNLLPITELGFDAQGFCASQDGLTVAWLSVEDTNEDGYLDPWRDSARIWFLQIAPRE
ncbi:hypothetical protein PLCT2_00856 [Planctomycetaceae bacterium]|nr:hypothetical protein PLCT2_00856 [Planctomycetaceae bacterium]